MSLLRVPQPPTLAIFAPSPSEEKTDHAKSCKVFHWLFNGIPFEVRYYPISIWQKLTQAQQQDGFPVFDESDEAVILVTNRTEGCIQEVLPDDPDYDEGPYAEDAIKPFGS